ncbi:hypothetical protein [Acidovorax sp.]|uniref:hypothetical protein n=1 Tax=Acidovorax sp. TaxID=1872122 RepID=UPI002ACE8FA7|nr:hypothetical protein [Acidovorax sp.]MDZ7862841.1 hypothetical protein [Acidovorax sp.]
MVAEGIAWFMVDVVAWGIGLVTGRAFKIDPGRAQHIGQAIMVAIVLGAGLTVTLLYS